MPLNEETEAEVDAAGERRFVSALLLLACLDAHAGDQAAQAWIMGEESARWAELIGLDLWPPKPAQLGSRRDLKKRSRDQAATFASY